MTEIAVNAWLKHWLTRQQKSKRPLILKDPSTHGAAAKDVSKDVSGKKHRIEWVKPDKEEEEADEDDMDTDDSRTQETDVVLTPDDAENAPEESGNGPDTPATAAKSRTSRRRFLSTLSEDAKYQQLLLLMDSAKVSLLAFSPDWPMTNEYIARTTFGASPADLGVLEVDVVVPPCSLPCSKGKRIVFRPHVMAVT